jgi:SAM-dependent methyltransferase
MMEETQIRQRLSQLSPEVPWAHLLQFAPNLYSVTPENEKFYKKAWGLSQVGEVLLDIAQTQVRGHSLQGKRVLDLACGEGGHSVQFAGKGAKVTGVEGRTLYVERARFAAEAMGFANSIEIAQGDVRKLPATLGTFDVTVFSGILHHLGQDDFDGMVAELGRVTDDVLLIYTHISTEMSIKNHALKGPVKTARGRTGYLFREHSDNASAKEREEQVRASLDNTHSFWADEESLVSALRSAGFRVILKAVHPHVFGWEKASYRPILVCKKG